MARKSGSATLELLTVGTRDRLDELADQLGMSGDRITTRTELIEKMIMNFAATEQTIELSADDRAIVDHAIELGANRAELEKVGLLWSAKAFVTRATSTKNSHSLDVSAMSDFEIESFGDTKNHPEISRERIRRTIARIERWNDSVNPDQTVVISATFIDKLRKELWSLSGGAISQISRRLLVEALPKPIDPHGLGQFQNRKIIHSLSIGVFAFRDLLEEMITDSTKLPIAQAHYEAIDNLD